MSANKPPKKGFLRFTHTILYSISGFKYAWKHEESFRQEFIIFILTTPLAFYLGKNIYDYILLIGSVFSLLIIELINSAIEAAVDRIGTERHELSKYAKDLGSAAVMFTIFLCIFIWSIIIYKNFIS